jgi:hypothetical protein
MMSFQLPKVSQQANKSSSEEASYHRRLSHDLVGDQERTPRRSVVGVRPVDEHVRGQPVLDYNSDQ